MRWLQGDTSRLQIKLIIIVKPLICALNPTLNLDKPLAASGFVIKALTVFTALFTYCPLHMTLPKPIFGISFQVITSQRHILLQKGMSDFESSCIQSVSCATGCK